MKTDSAELYSITNLVDFAGQHRTCIHMASEQDEEEEQVSGEWRRTKYRHSIGFLGHGHLSHAARERRL